MIDIIIIALLFIIAAQAFLILVFILNRIAPLIELAKPILTQSNEQPANTRRVLGEIERTLKEINNRLEKLSTEDISKQLAIIDERLFVDIPRAIEENRQSSELSDVKLRLSADISQLEHSVNRNLDEIARYLAQISVKD